MMNDMIKMFESARHVSVPIVIIRTADQMATAEALAKATPKNAIIQWDAARGITGVMSGDNRLGVDLVAKKNLRTDDNMGFVSALTALNGIGTDGKADVLPQGSLVIVHNAQRQLVSGEPIAIAASVQAVANIRDTFKQNFRMLVLLVPEFTAPPELAQDVFILDHELPKAEELREIVRGLAADAERDTPTLPKMDDKTLGRATEALNGLSSFAAEQQAAVSFEESGLNIEKLWERKRVTIEQTKGLRVWRGRERFSDLVGLDSVKARLRSRLEATAKIPIGVVLFLDEIDKVFANVEHDTSGVRLDQMTQFLTEMENNEWRGLVCVGVAGGGKSALAKAFGNEAGVPTISLDLGGMEGSHVGESEQAIRHAMSVIKAVGQGNAYVIATSNNASVMRPEVQRRFTDGIFFFDVMSDAERAACWKFYIEKYELDATQQKPNDDGWTGAEIRNCCRNSWDTGWALVESARFIVPMATSRADAVDLLRQQAHGRFLDANKFGPYQYSIEPMRAQVRAIHIPKAVVDEIQNMKES